MRFIFKIFLFIFDNLVCYYHIFYYKSIIYTKVYFNIIFINILHELINVILMISLA
jgi:hypothetical protein